MVLTKFQIMAYNKKNLLVKIIEIQELTLSLKKKGLTQKAIYRNEIENQYMISFSSYCSYLAINAKKELKELVNVKSEII